MEKWRISVTWPVLLGLFMLALTACSSAATSSALTYTWQMTVNETQVKDTLQTVEVVTQYNGSKNEVLHEQAPASGNVYVLIHGKVQKNGTKSLTFRWNDLKLVDSQGNEYQRHSNDSFLEQQRYSPRMSGLDLRLGQSEGWMAYEIPSASANGTLALVYRDDEGQREIPIKK